MDNYLKLKETIDKNIGNPLKEREIVDYLLSIKHFESINDWKNIIKLLFHVDEIQKYSPDKIIEQIQLAKEQFEEDEVVNFLIKYLKEESDIEKDFQNFFYSLNQQFKRKVEETIPHENVKEICNRRFERYTATGKDVYRAFSLFYSCWDFVDEKNIVHITSDALRIMRSFIDRVNEDYLNFIIRPKYSPAKVQMDGDFYSFVLEPFTDKIFGGWENFEVFLNMLGQQNKVRTELLKGISDFYKEYKINGYTLVKVPVSEFELSRKSYKDILRKWLT